MLARLRDRPHGFWVTTRAIYLGEVSYSLYMTHTLAQKVLVKVLPSGRFSASGVEVKIGVGVAYIALIVIFTLASYYLIERPCRKWLRGRLAKRV